MQAHGHGNGANGQAAEGPDCPMPPMTPMTSSAARQTASEWIAARAFKRLDPQARQLEVWSEAPGFEAALSEERRASTAYGGRSVGQNPLAAARVAKFWVTDAAERNVLRDRNFAR